MEWHHRERYDQITDNKRNPQKKKKKKNAKNSKGTGFNSDTVSWPMQNKVKSRGKKIKKYDKFNVDSDTYEKDINATGRD